MHKLKRFTYNAIKSLAPHFAFALRSTFLAVNKGYPLPKFNWKRTSNLEEKTGRIELITQTLPKNIYGWVFDNRDNFRRDFRIVGLRGNEKGFYMSRT